MGFNVDAKHPDYEAKYPLWVKCRDAVEGEEAIKSAGEAYLPRLSGQSAEEYGAYVTRAMFYGAAGRTILGLSGAIFRRKMQNRYPEANADDLKYMGRRGESVELFSKNVVDEVLTTGRAGILVDATLNESGDADVVYPYAILYKAEEIINWDFEIIDGVERPILVVLEEYVSERSADDPFTHDVVCRYRELVLEDGVYKQRLWHKVTNIDDLAVSGRLTKQHEDAWKVISEIVPQRNKGGTFDFIPFQFVNSRDLATQPSKPPLLDLVNINLSHYRTSADLEHGRHYTALPTPVLTGVDNIDTSTLKMGPGSAWKLSNPEARAMLLEFTGAGIASLRDGLADKERLMAIAGGRMLEERFKESEATATVLLRQAGEHATLGGIADTVSEGMTNVVWWLCDWSSKVNQEEINIRLNNDFGVRVIDSQRLMALFNAYQSGGMSFEVWFYNLQQMGAYPDDATPEEERARIAEGLPLPGMVTSLPGVGDEESLPGNSGRSPADEKIDDATSVTVEV